MDAPPENVPHTDDPFLKGVFNSPIIAEMRAGKAPPVYVLPASLGEHAAVLFQKFQEGLPQVGLGTVQAPNSGALVAYNPKITDPREILAADAAGSLDTIAVPLQTGGQAPGGPSGGPGAPPAQAGAPPIAPGPPPVAPAQEAPPPSLTAGLIQSNPATNPAQQARVRSMQPEPPVKQMLPSQGVLNGLMSRAS